MTVRRALGWLGGGLLLIAVAVASVVAWGYRTFNAPGPLAEERTLVIPRGAGLSSIAEQLAAANISDRPLVFEIGAKWTGQAAKLKPGEYRFAAAISPRAALDLLAAGRA